MADKGGYIGRNPGDSSVTIARQISEPTGVQTTFSFLSQYTPGLLDVYINGTRLIDITDYSATDGSTINLTSAATSGDVLEFVAYKAFNVSNVEAAPGNFTVENNLTVNGFISAGGSVTAPTFYGDGSGLTNVGVDTSNVNADQLTVAGITTFSGKTRILDDVEFHVGTNGSSGRYKFYRDSASSRNILYEDISGAEARFVSNIGGTTTAAFYFLKASTPLARFSVNNARLYAGGLQKFETTGGGVNVTGVVTATSFSGSGANLTDLNIPSGFNELDAALFN